MTSTPHPPYIVSQANEDIEEYRSSLRGFSVDVKQLSPGPFNGRTTIIELPGCRLIRRFVAARHTCSSWIPEGATLVFPLGAPGAFIRGRTRNANQQIGSLGNHEVFAVLPENYGHLLVTVPFATLVEHLSPAEAALFVDTLARIEHGCVDERRKFATQARLLEIFGLIEHAPAPLPPAVMRAYCREVVHLLFAYLASHDDLAPLRASNHEKILQRALQLIAAHPGHVFTLEEMARAVFASKRAVQYAFASLVGLSPMRFQKLFRLNQVRNELRLARSPVTFAGIIARFAFSNAGRTSREYAQLFGEAPADTLRQGLVTARRPAAES